MECLLRLLRGVEVHHLVGQQPAVGVVDGGLDDSIPRGRAEQGEYEGEGRGNIRGE